ncbi:MAG: VWA domain-containing protein [Pyrinomonadaceae bacterium]
MPRPFLITFIVLSMLVPASAQSGRTKTYSESSARNEKPKSPAQIVTTDPADHDVIRVETDLVMIPVRISDKGGKTVTNISKDEFKIFENGVEKEIAYFSDVEQPFTVALVLDMSYSSVFKLLDIQDAAKNFVSQLRPGDKVMVISFAEKPIVLCEPTSDRKILNIAIEGSRIASGTSLYQTLDMVLNQKLAKINGRKAIVLLSDGVDTTSKFETAATVGKDVMESDALVYPIKYNTYDDVQKSRRTTAPVQYDDNDRPYSVETRPVKGEREEDYAAAKEFLRSLARDTGGRLYNVTSATNLDQAFANIANELRKIYSLGYYPSGDLKRGDVNIRVRVYRPDLIIRAKESYSAH